jgi:hypothetical protein
MKILVTGVGGPTPRSFAISLKKFSKYKSYDLIATDVNQLSIGLYQKELFSRSYVVPRATDDDYWKVIGKVISNNRIELAVILPELEVLAWCRKAKEGKLPCKVLLPDANMAETLVDKGRMTEMLTHLDVVPSSVSFSREINDLKPVFQKLGKKFWVRSVFGTSGLGALKIESEEALKNWIQINPGVTTFLASEFLPGRNLACKMLYFNGKLIRAACAERVNYIMSKIAPSGITGNTSFGRLLNEPGLVDIANKALSELFNKTSSPKHGFFTVDFKEDDRHRALITEINIRHVAFTQCFAAAGANFAEDTIRLLDGDTRYDTQFRMYEFEKNQIFLRDVDSLPVLMKEHELLQ